MKKLSVVLSAALVLGLCGATSAQAGGCITLPPGDPVFDPGSSCKVEFSMNPAVAGASALVKGYTQYAEVTIAAPSFLKDTADDGLAAHLWVRAQYQEPMPPGWYESRIASVSGSGSTKDIEWSAAYVEAFDVRVCVGEGTANCTEWR
ncbi:hypothetical protein LFM09_46480 [Lentzea alba]|uniref:hypothetical protein n=1 Tax=Lentzea alba TaxID=2714351 RepID=UPI0039BF16C4